MTLDPASSSASPLSSLYRSTRQQRRSSPPSSQRTSPPLYSYRPSPSPDRTPITRLDDSDDEDDGKAPQLSALALMLLKDSPRPGDQASNPAGDGPLKSDPVVPFTVERNRSWSRSPDVNERPFLARTTSSGPHISREGSPEHRPAAKEMVTPAPGRARRLYSGTYSSGYALGSSGSGSSGDSAEPNRETENRYAGYNSIVRPGPAGGMMGGVPPSATASAVRWKRAGRGLVGGLAGAPRRGPKRMSDHTRDDVNDDNEADNEGSPDDARQGGSPNNDDIIGDASSRSGSRTNTPNDGSGRDSIENPLATISRRPRHSSPERLATGNNLYHKISIYNSESPSRHNDEDDGDIGSSNQRSISPPPAPRSPSPPPSLSLAPEPRRDKENMPPPTFRRTAFAPYKRLSPPTDPEKPQPPPPPAPIFKAPDQSPLKPAKSRSLSPLRASPALATKSTNNNNAANLIPQRAPPAPPAKVPPPPKMSMLQTVTATAGAAATNQRRSRATVSVNGKVYRRLDIMGKGGSSKVYKVMAENYKMFAMKKVTFHANDGEAAIRGYKGEIELLQKLVGEERVIRLYDWELNEEKQTLTMLMEQGETDLARILQLRYSDDTSRFDPSFVRHYWHEMLLCVQAVHRFNIIHSDLKPANFLLVAGRLKLIDFGIANAIQDDTVNVHRESQVGTLNYMSPEAIVDINAASGRPMQSHGHQRLMKIGAPSDVWSLGCILYQMTYGQTPFAHLSNLYAKISAIPDPSYKIEYPDTGIGGARVPKCLVDTIRACLEREKEKRPTIEQLLSEDDPFLHPSEGGAAEKEGMVLISEDMLVQLLQNTAEAVERNGKPDEKTIRGWAKDVFGKLGRLMKR